MALTASAALAADRVVVVTATAGFRHDSIPTAERVIADIAASTRWFEVTFAREQSQMIEALTPEMLAGVKMVMFVNTTGDLALPTRGALIDWVRRGGSFIGVHSASDTWHESPQYIDMLGGEFEHHPGETTMQVFVEDPNDLSTVALDSPHALFEEYYFFSNFDAGRVHLLLSLHNSPEDGSAGFYPLAWSKNYGAGRVFYTALGHRSDVWTSPWFRQHLTGAIAWGLHRDGVPRRRSALP